MQVAMLTCHLPLPGCRIVIHLMQQRCCRRIRALMGLGMLLSQSNDNQLVMAKNTIAVSNLVVSSLVTADDVCFCHAYTPRVCFHTV